MKTAKVRIALAINEEGNWYAYGFKDCKSWVEATDSFDLLDGIEHRYWIEAEVPIPDPEPDVIFAEAKPA